MDCVFCKIINGEIPSYKVYEDEEVYAFLDITQGTKGHTLVVPKTHVENIYALDASKAGRIFERIPKLSQALKNAFNPIGLNVLNNNDKPLQSVFHFHIHLIPRYEDDGMVLTTENRQDSLDDSDYIEIKEAIEKAL